MSELISGKEALIALANGKEVEYLYGTEWESVTGNQILITALIGDKFKFRLKPRTTKVELEIPAPFKPKDGDEFYFIDCETARGYSIDVMGQGCDGAWAQFGAWRTEKEVKQVVAALRQVFGGSHDN